MTKSTTTIDTILTHALTGSAGHAGALAHALNISFSRAADILNTTYTISRQDGVEAARRNLVGYLGELGIELGA